MSQIQLTDFEPIPYQISSSDILYAGVDNGFTGAAAILRKVHTMWQVIDLFPYDRVQPQRLLEFFSKYKDNLKCVVLERPFISLSRANVTKTNYEIFGRYLQTLDILGIHHIEVMPKQWQKLLSIANKADSTTKEQSIDTVKHKVLDSSLSIRQPAYSNRKLARAGWGDLVHFNDNWADAICMAITAEELGHAA